MAFWGIKVRMLGSAEIWVTSRHGVLRFGGFVMEQDVEIQVKKIEETPKKQNNVTE